MKRDVAITRLREMADQLERFASLWGDEPWALGAYVHGDLLGGAERFERLQLTFVVDQPPELVTWRTVPDGGEGLIHHLRLDKYPSEVIWRPAVWPVWNHHVRAAVRFWEPAGPHLAVLDALASGRTDGVPIAAPPDDGALAEQVRVELAAAERHLRHVADQYWEPAWRRHHKGSGIYPEDHLWRAVSGMLELTDAVTG